jgi:hypothetical protein
MQIAVQGDFFREEQAPVENEFFMQLWLQEARKHSVQLVFPVFGPGTAAHLQAWGAVTPLAPPAWLPVAAWAHKWKFRQQLPAFLKKQSAQLFIGQEVAGTAIPQLLFITAPRALELTGKNYTIATPTQWAAGEMTTLYRIPAEKIRVLPVAAPEVFTPAEWQQREDIKSQYAEGNEYFVFYGPDATAGDLLCLLKAFSVFKKWQKSSMKLIIVNAAEALLPDMETYRYRSDVGFLHGASVSDIAYVTAGAYCQVHPVAADTLGISLLQAFQCEVPAIATASPALQETGGNACLYAEKDDFAAMGQQMIQIYKDEALRNRLVLAGKEKAAANQPGIPAEAAWQLIRELTS